MARAHILDRERSALVFSISAYSVAACELVLHVQGEREAKDVVAWLKTATRHTFFEGGLDLVIVVRAARLFAPLLERAHELTILMMERPEGEPP